MCTGKVGGGGGRGHTDALHVIVVRLFITLAGKGGGGKRGERTKHDVRYFVDRVRK